MVNHQVVKTLYSKYEMFVEVKAVSVENLIANNIRFIYICVHVCRFSSLHSSHTKLQNFKMLKIMIKIQI